MKNILSLFILLIILTGLNAQNREYINKTIIIKVKQSQTYKTNTKSALDNIKGIVKNDLVELSPAIKNFNLKNQKTNKQNDLSTIYRIELKSAENLYFYLRKINQLDNIEYAEPYPVAEILDAPNDPSIANQYYLTNIKALEAFAFSTGDTNIVIGIVDSGTDLLHEDLKDNYKYNYDDPINNIDDDGDGYIDNFYGWDVADNDPNPQSLVNDNGDTNYHGTRVAGLASAVTNNNIGIASMGYNTKILPIKAMNSSGYIVAGYEGIVYAADHGCSIINCSWGSNTPSKFAQDVINYAVFEKKCLIVAAAGNKSASVTGRPDTWFYPASYDNVMSVAATGPSDIRWSGSSYATTVDVSAPGENVYSTRQFNLYGNGSGTSFASPIVAGLAGLLKAKRPDFTVQQLSEQIRITADVIDTLSENIFYSRQLGYGRINALRALTINNLPSIRIDSLNLTTTSGGSYRAGDTLKVSFIATNYLAQASNTTIRLTTNSDHIFPINNILKTGKIGTLESTNNKITPLLFKVTSDLSYNQKVLFIFEMKDEGYDDYQIFEENINNNYININENKISTTLTSNGKIGYVDLTQNLGIGLIYNNTQNLLSLGGIMLGNSNMALASSLLEVEEFGTNSLIDTTRNDDNVLIGKTEYSTLTETGLSVNITQKTLASAKDAANSMLVHLYNLKNETNLAIEGLKFSQFMDWDLYSNTSNQISFVNELNLAYTYSNSNEVIYTGICLLNNMSSIPYGFDMITGGNGGIDITNGFNNDLKWYTMTNSRPQAGNAGDSIDVASMLTTDFFSINAGDSIEIAFAHIVNSNYYDLVNAAIMAREQYQFTKIETKSAEHFKLFPNPAKNEINVSSQVAFDNTTIEIYDQAGRLQFAHTYSKGDWITLNISHLDPGIYIINSLSKNKKLTSKFIKVP